MIIRPAPRPRYRPPRMGIAIICGYVFAGGLFLVYDRHPAAGTFLALYALAMMIVGMRGSR